MKPKRMISISLTIIALLLAYLFLYATPAAHAGSPAAQTLATADALAARGALEESLIAKAERFVRVTNYTATIDPQIRQSLSADEL